MMPSIARQSVRLYAKLTLPTLLVLLAAISGHRLPRGPSAPIGSSISLVRNARQLGGELELAKLLGADSGVDSHHFHDLAPQYLHDFSQISEIQPEQINGVASGPDARAGPDNERANDESGAELEIGTEFYIYTPGAMDLQPESELVMASGVGSEASLNARELAPDSERPTKSAAADPARPPAGPSELETDASWQVKSVQPPSSVPTLTAPQLAMTTSISTTITTPTTSTPTLAGPDNRLDFRTQPYCIGHNDSESNFHWRCQGIQLIKIPVDLNPKPMSLRISNTGIEILTKHSLPYYQETLRDFSMDNAPRLSIIEPGTFAQLSRLRVVYIFQAPKLISFNAAILGLHPDLTIIRIQQTGLRHWPDLSGFSQERILTSIDLDNNKIAGLGSKPIGISTELLNLEFNQIISIDEFTFNGSEIGVLSLKSNRQLSFIHENAFANLNNLIKLDLSSTSISQLPTVGLQQLRRLIIRDTYTLKRIPSIYVFPMLEEAHLTYACHCCSFRYPQTHDPSAYEEHLRLQDEINALCSNKRDQMLGVEPATIKLKRPPQAGAAAAAEQQQPVLDATNSVATQSSEFEGVWFGEEQKEQKVAATSSPGETNTIKMGEQAHLAGAPAGSFAQLDARRSRTRSTSTSTSTSTFGSTWPPVRQSADSGPAADQQQSANNVSQVSLKKLWPLHNIECGELAVKQGDHQNITCTPEPDAFNPCEDIMGYPVLRVAVWFVVGASVFGNLSVIVVLMAVFKRLSVPKFLQLNLAIGDLSMGVYLAMLALADLTTVGAYFNYAIDWQHGFGCKLAGAVSLFASQLSIFTLSVITFERYYTITYSIDLNMRLQLGWAARIMLIGWLYAFASAMLPIFGDINSYSKTSICLPLRTTFLVDRIFIVVLLIIDSSAFLIIFASYLKMYLLIVRQKTQATAKERTVAMRMALLVATDFACWAPIIFFGATAILGRPLISVTNSKILIVFFYPLNSMANPFLYVISTRQYRRDLNYLTARWRVWRKNLFKANNESYYSNNAYCINQYPAGLNAQLGAVAAVTGVANHLRHNQLGESNLNGLQVDSALASNAVALVRAGGCRVVCTKSNPGQYIIRHQILTDKNALFGDERNRGQSRRRLQQLAAKRSLENGPKSGANVRGQPPADQPQSAGENLVQLRAKEPLIDCEVALISERVPAETIKLISVSEHSRARSPDCRWRARAQRNHSTCQVSLERAQSRLRRHASCCCRCSCLAGANSKRCNPGGPINVGPSDEVNRARRDGASKAQVDSPDLKSITLITSLPGVSQSETSCKRQVDILGNLHTQTEQTSSISGLSSPPISQQALAVVDLRATCNGHSPGHRQCHHNERNCVSTDDGHQLTCHAESGPILQGQRSLVDCSHYHHHRHHHHHYGHHHHRHHHHEHHKHNHGHHHRRHRRHHERRSRRNHSRGKRASEPSSSGCDTSSLLQQLEQQPQVEMIASSEEEEKEEKKQQIIGIEIVHSTSPSQVNNYPGQVQQMGATNQTVRPVCVVEPASLNTNRPVRQLESILKPPSAGRLDSGALIRAGSKKRTHLLGLFRVGSLRSERRGEIRPKKRVSIMSQHHSG